MHEGIATPKASAKFIFATIFLDTLGIGFLIPVFPDVIRRFNADPVFVNHFFGYFISVYALLGFLASPVIGSLSDRFGRRPVLLVSLLGASIDYLLMAFAPNLWLLFLGRIISGLTGASMTVASSYMADISNDKNRSSNFGLIGAAFGLGFIAGPAIGGFLGSFGAAVPFLGAALLNLLNFLFGFFILPESLPENLRRKIEFKKLNPFMSLLKILKPSAILTLVWVYFLIYTAGQSHPSTWTLYTQHKFGWTSVEVGLSLAFVGVMIAFAQGYLTRLIIPKLGEPKSLYLGLLFYVIGFVLFGISNQSWMMYATMIPFSLSGLAIPSLQSMVSKNIPPQEQGELQGSLISLANLSAIIGPLLFTNLFSYFTDRSNGVAYFPGVSYITAAFICLFSMLILIPQMRQFVRSAS